MLDGSVVKEKNGTMFQSRISIRCNRGFIPVTATLHGLRVYNESKEEASRALSNFRRGTAYDFWASKDDPEKVLFSLAEGWALLRSRSLALAYTSFCAPFGFLFLSLFLAVRNSWSMGYAEAQQGNSEVAARSRRRRPRLNRAQRKDLLKRFEVKPSEAFPSPSESSEVDEEAQQHELDVDDDGWSCAICLDDSLDGQLASLVRLPCQHIFHNPCVYRWLKKGRSVCPLCNENLMPHADPRLAKDGDRPRHSTLEESDVDVLLLGQYRRREDVAVDVQVSD